MNCGNNIKVLRTPVCFFSDVSVEEMVLSEVKINGVEISTKHSSYMAMKEVGLPYYPGEIVLKYEDLARNNISAIENVSCVMEVYEAVIEDEKQEDGVNATYLERGDLLYTSPEITFEVHEVE